jgi:hypothetical protein
MFHIIVELFIPEYWKRAVATHAPVSVITILLIVAVPVVVIIVPVEIIAGASLSIQSTVANVLHVL